MFDMTNDSDKFLTRAELEKRGWKPAPLNRWAKGKAEAVPLYEGKMVQMYDHRAADVVVNSANLHRAAQQDAILDELKSQSDRFPTPQYWVDRELVDGLIGAIGFKDVTAPTNVRTMITAFVPVAAYGNTLPVFWPDSDEAAVAYANFAPLLQANLASYTLDFLARQKCRAST